LAGDYSCVDFDNAIIPTANGWTLAIANGGADTLTMQRASSLPYSWSASVGTGDQSKAQLAWHVSGAQPIAAVTVAADLSPSAGIAAQWDGSLALLCIQFGSNTACLNYTVGQDTSFASAYTGYYISTEYYGGGVSLNEYQVYGTLQPNLWTRIQIQVTASSGVIAVVIPGATNAPVSGHFDPDTTADVIVGPKTNGATAGWAGYVDNVTASVTRSK
jgi:hypothetical protein